MIKCELITKTQNELDAALLQAKKDISEYAKKFNNEFEIEWSKKKFKWFFKKRRQRKLKYKIYRRHRRPIFELVENILDDVVPKALWSSFDQLININDIALGDKNYATEEDIKKFRQNIFEAGGCSLLKEESNNDI